MGKHIWAYWDCQYCGKKGVRGDSRECNSCGMPRGENTKFYMKNTVEYVSTTEKKDRPDWLCSYCKTLNVDSNTVCESCGASRTQEELNYFEMHENKTEQTTQTQEVIAHIRNNESSMYEDSVDIQKETKVNNGVRTIIRFIRKYWGVFLGIAFGVFLTWFLCYMLVPYETKVTIDAFSWQREIQIEELKTFDESGWSLPTGARLEYKKNEIKTYENVFDHYETKTRQVAKQELVGYETYVSGYRDLGNGQFEEITAERPIYETYYEEETYQEPVYRQEPVYAIKFYYEIDRWTYTRNIKTTGNNKDPYWGEVVLAKNERRGKQYESYYIHSATEKYKVTYSEWQVVDVGDTLTVKVRRIDNRIEFIDID